jgi:tetratricopeptide (TPR) repeat protein
VAEYILSLIGAPSLKIMGTTVNDEITFRYRDTWTLLATLVLDPADTNRDLLVARLGLDSGGSNGRNKLRLRLDDLRNGSRNIVGVSHKGIGSAVIVASRNSVKLVDGTISTDIDFVQRTLIEASTTTDVTEAKNLLQSCVPLLRGNFLDGISEEKVDSEWFDRWRQYVKSLTAEVWMLYGNILKHEGRIPDAFDAFRRAYLANPIDSDAIAEILSSTAVTTDRPLVDRSVPLDALIPRLEVSTESNQQLTEIDENLIKAAVSDRLRQLSSTTQHSVMLLATIPVSVSVDDAVDILNASKVSIVRAVESFSFSIRDDVIMIQPVVRDALRQLTERATILLAERLFLSHHYNKWNLQGRPEILLECPDICTSIAKCIIANAHSVDVQYLLRLVQGANSFDQSASVTELFRYLSLRTPESLHEVTGIVQLQIYVLTRCQRYKEAVDLFINHCSTNNSNFVTDWYTPLLASHHGERHKDFVTIKQLYFDQTHSDANQMFQVYQIMAEHSLSNKDYASAREYNDQAMECYRVLFPKQQMHGRLLTQHAYLSQICCTPLEQLHHWDVALMRHQSDLNYEAQAECLREIAIIHEVNGHFALARSVLDQAIRFCDESGKPDAMSVCLAILARIKVKTGLVADGFALLTQVKNYWQQKGHRNWTDHFSEQLSELEQYVETI